MDLNPLYIRLSSGAININILKEGQQRKHCDFT